MKKIFFGAKRQPLFALLSNSLLLFIFLLIGSSSLMAQDQFLWTNATTSGLWTDSGNWRYFPYGSNVDLPAPYYPGQHGLINTGGPQNDIVIFTNITDANCHINTSFAGTNSARRVGGIIVKGYSGTIVQADNNRFNVSESTDAGGHSIWDGTTVISSLHPLLTIVNSMTAYQAYFEFATDGGFKGGANPSLGSITPSYALLFAVPLTIKTGDFKASKDEMRIRHDATIFSTAYFDNDHQGTVVLSNRSSASGTRNYHFENVAFWNLKVTPNGNSPRVKNFSGGICTVENNFITTGVNGQISGVGSYPVKMNVATAATEIHIKQDLIVYNIFNGSSPSYFHNLAFGNIVLVMNGTAAIQRIRHDEPSDFTGNLPSLRINKTAGNIVLDGPIAVNGHIEFVAGAVVPNAPTTDQNDLTIPNDLFVLNNLATVGGASDASFCEGPIRVRRGTTIELPIGKGNNYRGAIVRPLTGVSANNIYTAEYFDQTPIKSGSLLETGLNRVSDCEVWAIQKQNTADSWQFHLELSFDTESCTPHLYDVLCNIVVSRWEQSSNQWVSHGNGGLFNTTEGDQTVRTNTVIMTPNLERSPTSPDLFTFGFEAAPPCADCEVAVCMDYCETGGIFSFNPNIILGVGSVYNSISWDFGDGGSSTDLTPTHTFDDLGVHLVTVTVTATAGASTCSTSFTFGIYNNNCVSIEGISKAKKAKMAALGKEAIINIFPNPSSSGQIQLELQTPKQGIFDYMIINNLGKKIQNGQLKTDENTTINTAELTAGMYYIIVYIEGKRISQPFVINNQ